MTAMHVKGRKFLLAAGVLASILGGAMSAFAQPGGGGHGGGAFTILRAGEVIESDFHRPDRFSGGTLLGAGLVFHDGRGCTLWHAV